MRFMYFAETTKRAEDASYTEEQDFRFQPFEAEIQSVAPSDDPPDPAKALRFQDPEISMPAFVYLETTKRAKMHEEQDFFRFQPFEAEIQSVAPSDAPPDPAKALRFQDPEISMPAFVYLETTKRAKMHEVRGMFSLSAIRG
ncbi:MAG: hypothetical protein IPJ30_25550 [Acidobacteria bacterium]|nr:hypothetical protein [Acidobacteriota bacterium]